MLFSYFPVTKDDDGDYKYNTIMRIITKMSVMIIIKIKMMFIMIIIVLAVTFIKMMKMILAIIMIILNDNYEDNEK